jgi:signal transduction histidine kinase
MFKRDSRLTKDHEGVNSALDQSGVLCGFEDSPMLDLLTRPRHSPVKERLAAEPAAGYSLAIAAPVTITILAAWLASPAYFFEHMGTLVVLTVAIRWNLWAAVATSLVAVLAANLAMRTSFVTTDVMTLTRDAIDLTLFLAVAAVATTLVARARVARDIAAEAVARERRLNDALEQQAAGIAQTLHDEAGELLTMAHLGIADISRDVAPDVGERLRGVRSQLDRVEDHLRLIAHELRPKILDDLGLVPALQFLVQSVGRRRGLTIGLDVGQTGRLAPVIETTVYRFVQEALNNVTRHAHAAHARVALAKDRNELTCQVADDGVGLTVAPESDAGGGLGLSGIRSRVEVLGGTMAVQSDGGRGTAVTISIPLT